MEKSYFIKVLNGRGCSTSSDFTVEEKKKLFTFFSGHGMTKSTAYNRFFRDGFKPWEVMGVEKCIQAYCEENSIPVPDDVRTFFQTCGRKESFKLFMDRHGMSRPTVSKRFSEWSFKEWELEGVEKLLDRLLAEEVEDA